MSGAIPNASFPSTPSVSFSASGWMIPARTSRYICSSGPDRGMAAPPFMRIALSTTLAANLINCPYRSIAVISIKSPLSSSLREQFLPTR